MAQNKGCSSTLSNLLNCFILLTTLLATSLVHATMVQFRISKPTCMLHFMKSISGIKRGASPNYKELYLRSKYNTEKNSARIELYKSLIHQSNAYFRFNRFKTPGPGRGRNIVELMEIRSASSSSLSDFSERIFGLVPYDLHRSLISELKYWEPIYNKLVWDKNYSAIEKYRKKVQRQYRVKQMDNYVQKIAKFINTSWPQGIPFIVTLIPIEKRLVRGTKAQSIGNVEMIEIVLTEDKTDQRMGVILHELTHSLHNAQSVQVQDEISRWYSSSKDSNAKYAHHILSEGLATVLGNGIGMEIFSGSKDQKEWYNDSKINSYSKNIYTDIKQYIDGGKSLDRRIVNTFIKKYSSLFPDAFKMIDVALSPVLIMTGGSLSEHVVLDEFFNHIKINSSQFASPIKNATSLKRFQESSSGILMVLIGREIEQLKKYSKLLEGIGGFIKFSTVNGGGVYTSAANKKPTIVFHLKNKSQLKNAFIKLMSLKKFQTKHKFLSF